MSLTVGLTILAMLVLNGLFAAYELVLASVRTERLKVLAERKRRGAATALRMKQRMEGSLAVVQLGITLVGVIAAAIGGASMDEGLFPRLIQNWLGVNDRVAEALAVACFVLPF